MNFPSAVHGQMPFVDTYKEEQIKRVIEKHRHRHHSGPDTKMTSDKSAKHKNTHSMPILWQSVYAGQRPRFISMPTLDDNRAASYTTRHSLNNTQNLSDGSKSHKHSLLSSLKKLFSSKRDDNSIAKVKSKHGSSGAIVHGNQSQPYSSPSKNRKHSDSDAGISGVRSPKRQRMRTISNISGVMETIEEVNEIMASTDNLSDDDSSSSSEITYQSASELSANSLLCNWGNFGNLSDSSSSHHGSADIICAA